MRSSMVPDSDERRPAQRVPLLQRPVGLIGAVMLGTAAVMLAVGGIAVLLITNASRDDSHEWSENSVVDAIGTETLEQIVDLHEYLESGDSVELAQWESREADIRAILLQHQAYLNVVDSTERWRALPLEQLLQSLDSAAGQLVRVSEDLRLRHSAVDGEFARLDTLLARLPVTGPGDIDWQRHAQSVQLALQGALLGLRGYLLSPSAAWRGMYARGRADAKGQLGGVLARAAGRPRATRELANATERILAGGDTVLRRAEQERALFARFKDLSETLAGQIDGRVTADAMRRTEEARGAVRSMGFRAVSIAVVLGLLTGAFGTTASHRLARWARENEEARTTSEESYREIFESAGFGVAILSSTGAFVSANEAMRELTGFDAAPDLVGVPLARLCADSGCAARVQGLLRGGEPAVPVEIALKRADDTIRTIELRRCTDPSWEPSGGTVQVVAADVTEERKLRDLIAAAATEWTEIIDAIAFPIMVVGPDLRIRRCNAAAAELGGIPVRELAARSLRGVGGAEPWHMMARLAEEVVASAVGRSAQVSGDDGGLKHWELTATPMVLRGTGQCAIVMCRDVTATVELAAALRDTHVMAATGLVASGVAHEVRNPLHGMEAIIAALEVRARPEDGLAPFLEHLRRQINRVSGLMQELLEYGRPAPLEMALAAVEDVIRDGVQRCEDTARRGEVNLQAIFGRDLPLVLVDQERMVRVIENLVRNGIQHTPPGGVVQVVATEERAARGAQIRCEVKDSGPGFAEEDLPRVFEPFHTRRRGGTGLGLSIALRTVREHGGTLAAGNREAGGAVVSLTLPAIS